MASEEVSDAAFVNVSNESKSDKKDQASG